VGLFFLSQFAPWVLRGEWRHRDRGIGQHSISVYEYYLIRPDLKKVKVKQCIAVTGIPSHSYGTSLAIWDHTVLPATRHKRTRPPSPQPVGRYSIYLPRRDGRLSWPRLPGNAPAGNRTGDLSITSPTPYHYTNRATRPYVYVKLSTVIFHGSAVGYLGWV